MDFGAQFDGLFRGAGLDWMPDSRHVVFDGLNETDGDFRYRRSLIYSIDVVSEEIDQLTKEPGLWASPAVSGNGRLIAYTGYAATDKTYAMERLYVMDSDGGNSRLITADFDRTPSSPICSDNDRIMYFTAQNAGYVTVFRSDLGGDVRAITDAKQVFQLDSTDGSTSIGVGTGGSYFEPGDIFSFALSGRGEPKKLTAVNSDLLAGKTLGAQEEIWFEASDRNRAHGWIVKPPDFDSEKTYPLLMEIHGGGSSVLSTIY